MIRTATISTVGLVVFATMSALLYQNFAENTLNKMGMVNNSPTGSPISNCLFVFFSLSRFASQYSINCFSLSDNIISPISQRNICSCKNNTFTITVYLLGYKL